jgi:hypothetical protein
MASELDPTSKQISDLIRSVIPGRETIFQLAESLEEGGDRLEVSFRELPRALPDEPEIARPLARSHVFHSIETFAGYLNEKSLALADVDSMMIGAVLDETLDHDREEVYFAAKIHPAFAPWHALLGKVTPVIDFAVHCMKYRRTIVQPDGYELAEVMSQVKASKAVTKWVGVGKKSINGVMVELEIAGERKGTPVELPDTIAIECPIYIGNTPVHIEIDLLVTEVREQIVVYCTSTQFEAAKIEAFQQFVQTLTETGNGTVGFGTLGHREWRLVK